MNRNFIVLFLIANFIIATFLFLNLTQKKVIHNTAAIAPTIAHITAPIVPPSVTPPFCIVYGPMNAAEKEIMDNVVAIDKAVGVASKQQQYEIYWNLGDNSVKAKELFERQKSGPLQEDRFQLVYSEGQWIVPIARLSDNVENAKIMAVQLAEKANKVNAGGRWQYRTLPEVYYYQIKDANIFSAQSIERLHKGLQLMKKPCSEKD